MSDAGSTKVPAGGAEGSPSRKMMASEVFLQSQYEESGIGHYWKFILAGVLFHIVIFMVTFPEFKYDLTPVDRSRKVLTVRKYVPPPPKQQPKKKIEKKITKKIPIPDPTPDEPEPIIEPEPPPEPEPLPDDVDILLGDPEPPPVTGPLIPGIGGVSEPERTSMVEPDYPELARRARIEGKVILRAIIRKDGSVSDIEVLKEPAANLGFAAAAKNAVKQWRYRPATQNGRPVDVYFTVVVNFSLE